MLESCNRLCPAIYIYSEFPQLPQVVPTENKGRFDDDVTSFMLSLDVSEEAI